MLQRPVKMLYGYLSDICTKSRFLCSLYREPALTRFIACCAGCSFSNGTRKTNAAFGVACFSFVLIILQHFTSFVHCFPTRGTFYEKGSCKAGFSACGGSRKRHSSIPPQCDPRGVFLSYGNKVSYTIKKNVHWHILAPRRGCFSNHLPLRRVCILAEHFCRMETKFPIRQKSVCSVGFHKKPQSIHFSFPIFKLLYSAKSESHSACRLPPQ